MAEVLENKVNKKFNGVPVYVTPYFPYRPRYKCCDLKTRKKSFVEGEVVHVVCNLNYCYCSQEFFDNLPNEKEEESTNQ